MTLPQRPRIHVSPCFAAGHAPRAIGRFIVLAWLLMLGVEVAAPATPIKIMPLGDSITEGITGNASYRYYLWQRLQAAGHQVDFVGSMSGVYGGPPLFSDFDQDHEGHWGWRVDEILAHIGTWAHAVQPDVVLIHLGHNDLWDSQSISSTIDELGQLIDALRSVNPHVQVLLAQVIPSTEAALVGLSSVNAQIPALVAVKTTSSSAVLVVDQYSSFDAVVETWDGVHPNAEGEQHMADTWFAWLDTLLRSGCVRECSRVAATGQAIAYADGDDGELQAGVPSPTPRFQENGNGTVTDNLTGLTWLKNANCFGFVMWAQALAETKMLAHGSCGLTDGSAVGDWRLPNVKELQSLIDFGRASPALPTGHPFVGVQPDFYWSSTTLVVFPDAAWGIGLNVGDAVQINKISTSLAWPVRGPQ